MAKFVTLSGLGHGLRCKIVRHCLANSDPAIAPQDSYTNYMVRAKTLSDPSGKGPDRALSIKQVVLRIVLIVLTVDLMTVVLFSAIPTIWHSRLEPLLHPAALVVVSAPLIYVWVIKPFITAHNNAVSHITHMAHYDPLTQLPNRRLLSKSLPKCLANCARDRAHGALLFIDLDGLKSVNDNYGHDAGDTVLVETAKRLQSITHREDFVSRIGGDEFVLMIQGLGSDEDKAFKKAESVAKLLQKSLERPTYFEHNKLQVSSSIGIRLLGSNKLGGGEAIRDADNAMYRAKHAGGGRIAFYAGGDTHRKRAS